MRSLRGDFSSAFQLMSCARQAHAVAAIGPRQHAHHQRRVIDGARHRSGDAADIGRIDRNAPEAWLQRDQAAPAGRQPHRAADVGAEMQRAVTGRTRGARAGTGAAGILAEVPGIAGEGMETGEARRQHAVIRHGGLGKDHRAGFAQARGRRRILLRRHQLDAGGAQRHRQALGGDIVLDGDGHAVERADRLALLPAFGRCLGDRARAIGIERIERLDVRLPHRDMRQHVLQHFRRRELPGAIALDQVDGAEIVQRGDLFVFVAGLCMGACRKTGFDDAREHAGADRQDLVVEDVAGIVHRHRAFMADPEIGAGHRLHHVGKILAAHLRLRAGDDLGGIDHRARHFLDHARTALPG